MKQEINTPVFLELLCMKCLSCFHIFWFLITLLNVVWS